MRRSRHPFVFLAAVAALALAAACGSSTAPVDPSGFYSLRTVDGDSVPLVIAADTGTDRLELTSGFLLLSPIGTYTFKLSKVLTVGDSVDTLPESDYGQWDVQSQTVYLYSDQGGGFQLALDAPNGALSLVLNGLGTDRTLLFTK